MKKVTVGVCLIILTSCFYTDTKNAPLQAVSEWTRDTTTYFRLHAQKGVRSEKKLKAIGETAERIQHELLTLIKEQQKQKLEVYFLKDRETLTSYTGFSAKGYTNTQKGIVYFVDKDPFHLALRHEIMHALSWRLWCNPSSYWLSEGIAVFASGNCGGYGLHVLAHALNKENKLISFEKLTDTFDFKSIEPSLQAASMVQYIYDIYGITALKAFWAQGIKNVQNIIGITSAELEQNWRKTIQQEKFNAAVNWSTLKESGCE